MNRGVVYVANVMLQVQEIRLHQGLIIVKASTWGPLKRLEVGTYMGRLHSDDGQHVLTAPLRDCGWDDVPAGVNLTMFLPIEVITDEN